LYIVVLFSSIKVSTTDMTDSYKALIPICPEHAQ